MKRRVDSEAELGAVAAWLGPYLKAGDVVTLKGDLGAGKTSFSRNLINSLSDQDEEVPSPTFTLVQTYDLPSLQIWHFDLYRLAEEERDVLELGWEEARRDGAALVEWADRLGGLLPRDRLEIEITFVKDSENSRLIELTPQGRWKDRLPDTFLKRKE